MKVMTARVVDGKIDIGDAELEEGTAVAILISEDSGFNFRTTTSTNWRWHSPRSAAGISRMAVRFFAN
jgi:hypothetical protein